MGLGADKLGQDRGVDDTSLSSRMKITFGCPPLLVPDVVRTVSYRSLSPKSFGASVRVMLYPSST